MQERKEDDKGTKGKGGGRRKEEKLAGRGNEENGDGKKIMERKR